MSRSGFSVKRTRSARLPIATVPGTRQGAGVQRRVPCSPSPALHMESAMRGLMPPIRDAPRTQRSGGPPVRRVRRRLQHRYTPQSRQYLLLITLVLAGQALPLGPDDRPSLSRIAGSPAKLALVLPNQSPEIPATASVVQRHRRTQMGYHQRIIAIGDTRRVFIADYFMAEPGSLRRS